MEKNLGIVGFGVLGKALKHVFETKFNIFIYDKYQESYSDIYNMTENCHVVFLAVPTPMKENGEIDLSYVENALETISEALKDKKILVVLRSTIIPGTTENLQKKFKNLDLVFNPEFLTEKNFLNDMRNTDRVVIGAKDMKDAEKIRDIYKEIFPEAKYILTIPKNAEMIKYASNVTLASQIAIANELYQICQECGVDYNLVKDTILLDKRIGKNIEVPGPDGNLGFGGKCFPKDLNALICLAEEKGYNPELLKQVWKSNLKLRKEQDWLKIKGATSKNRFESVD